MAAGHQLRKLGQSRQNSRHRYVEYMPRLLSVYALIFFAGSLVVFCFLFFDVRSSPTSLLRNAGRGFDALKVQVVDASIFYLARSAPADSLAFDKDKQPTVSVEGNLSESDSAKAKSEQKRKLQPHSSKEEDVVKVESESKRLDDARTEEQDVTKVESESKSPDDGRAKEQDVVEVESESKGVDDALVSDSSVDTEIPVANSLGARQPGAKDLEAVFNAKELETRKKGQERKSESKKRKSKREGNKKKETRSGGNSPTEEDLEETLPVDSRTMRDFMEFGGTLKAVEEYWAAQPAFGVETCDFSKGQWVYDENYPLYKPGSCPFVDGGFQCVENGRPSDEFQKYRWQPFGCNLPRFNPRKMLERMRGSRMAFVGDSIGRNHWESMMCMLAEAVPNKTRIYEVNGERISKHTGSLVFRFEDFDCTVEYYRSPYLVPQTRPPRGADPKVKSVLRVKDIDWSASKWQDADIVVFNSGHWWSFGKTIRGGNYFQEGKKIAMNMSVDKAFETAMTTVARFVAEGMDAIKSQVFFRSYAPVHFHGGTWDRGGSCHVETKPLQKFPFKRVWEDRTCNNMVSEVMALADKNPVTFLNVTYLSDLRPDGHSAIWQRVPPAPKNRQDCSHWCLPGVPDVWNEILFASLLEKGKGRWGSRARTISS